MKKLINKLFEWLGYRLLSKKEYNEMNKTLSRCLRSAQEDINKALRQKKGWYTIAKTEQDYEVRFYFAIADFVVIKVFPFGENKEYALLCAEELWDKLKEETN